METSAYRGESRNLQRKYLSKQVLWVSVGQLAAKLQAVKVGGLKRILLLSPLRASQIETIYVKEVNIFPNRYSGSL